MKAKTIISKAQLARDLGFSRARISQLVKSGMPVRPDGKLDREQATDWISSTIIPQRGGWGWSLRGSKESRHKRPRAREAFAMNQVSGFRVLLDKLCLASSVLPELAVRSGLVDIDVAALLPEAFIAVIWLLAGDEITDPAYGWTADGFGEDRPMQVEPDYGALAKRYKLKPPDPKRMEAMLDRFDNETLDLLLSDSGSQ